MKGSDVVRAPLKLFISYSRANSAFVDRLEHYLQTNGYEVWVDRSRIEGGQDWIDKIARAIRERDVMLVVLSRASVISDYVKMEYHYAQTHKKIVIPLEYERCDVPMDLDRLHRIPFQPNPEKGLADCCIRSIVSQPGHGHINRESSQIDSFPIPLRHISDQTHRITPILPGLRQEEGQIWFAALSPSVLRAW